MFWWILGGLLLIVALAVLGVSAALFRFAMMRPKTPPVYERPDDPAWAETERMIEEGRTWFLSQSPRTVSIRSRDGLKLAGHFLPHPEAERTVICVHGYQSCGLRDYGAALPYYYSTKSNLLVIDQRAHGASEGRYITFGVKERFDLLDWIGWVNGECGALPVVLSGISMGSATVMITLGLDLPANVTAAIADCGYSSLWEEFSHVLGKNFRLPDWPFLHCAERISRLVTGVDFRSVTAADALARTRVPVLFVHGGADDFVPMWMTTERTYPACASEKKLIIVDKAGHGMSYSLERERCEKGILWAMGRK